MRASLGLLSLAVLAACSGAGRLSLPAENERPVMERPTTSDAQEAARIHVELGSAYFQSGRFGVALDEARAAEASDSNYAPVYHLYGQVYMYLDDVGAARRSFEKAIRLAPGDPEIGNSYGWFLCASGHEPEGLERLAAVVRNPYYKTPSLPYTNAGLCYLRMKDDAAAEGQFLHAIQADPGNSRARFHLAAIAYRRQAYEIAQRYLDEVHQNTEPGPDSLWLGIRIARKTGNRDREAGYVAQLHERFPTSREYENYTKGQFE